MEIKRILRRVIQRFILNKYVKTEPTDLIEYDLLNFNEDLDKAWEKINALYDKILHKDNYWHLFYEGDFSTLRCSPEYSNDIEKFFKKHKIESKYNGKWIDGSSIVEKYKDMYRNIFHEFSMLAIHLDESDLYIAADRVCHSFFNHNYYMAKKYRRPFENDSQFISSMMWEAEMMGRLSIYRAHYIGKYDMAKYYKKLEKDRDKDKSNDVDDEDYE